MNELMEGIEMRRGRLLEEIVGTVRGSGGDYTVVIVHATAGEIVEIL